jgi:hypothetical protein
MMQATDLVGLEDAASIDWMDLPSFGAVHLERLMRPVLREKSILGSAGPI